MERSDGNPLYDVTTATRHHAHVLRTRDEVDLDQLTRERAQTVGAGQTEVGHTADAVVYTDGSAQGDATAQAVLQTVEADYQATQAWFGGLALPQGQEGDDQTTARTALPIHVLIDPQAGGAYHFGCNATDIYLEPTPEQGSGLFVAELVEIFEAAINNGWSCGQTNGEGLSRVLAGERNPNLGSVFGQTEQAWWADGHQDFVNDNSADDTNADGNGCGTLFLYYLHSQLGYDWTKIVTTGGATLGETYQRLTGQDPTAGFAAFVSAVASLDSGSGLNIPPSGNPFPLAGSTVGQVPVAQPQPAPVPAGVPSGAMDGGAMGGNMGGDMGSDMGGLADVAADGLLVEQEAVVVAIPADGSDSDADPAYVVAEAVTITPFGVADGGDAPDDGSAADPSASPEVPAASPAPAAPEPVAIPAPVALDRTAPLTPRGLDTAESPARKGSGVRPVLAVVLVVLALLVVLAVLFTTGFIQF